MAVARIHGKVKCRRFKERERRALLTEHGITGNGFLFSVFLSFILIFFMIFCTNHSRRLYDLSLLLPGNRMQWLAVIKGPNLSERAL